MQCENATDPVTTLTSANCTKNVEVCVSACVLTSQEAILVNVPTDTDLQPITARAKVKNENFFFKSYENDLFPKSKQDIDECARPGVCRPEETCLNTRGGYYCNAIVCPPNYVRDTEHRKYVNKFLISSSTNIKLKKPKHRY